jgi:hypothetical protein
MAKAKATSQRKPRKGFGSFLLGLINPIRDPSLLAAIVTTIIEEGGSNTQWWQWALFLLANWLAWKAVIWLLVNFFFSSIYLLRKSGWVLRNPRLAWRLLDALGTEEIIIGGLRPDMFTTGAGGLHEGELGRVVTAGANYYGGLGYQQQQPYGIPSAYPEGGFGGNGMAEEMQELLSTYARLISDWTTFTEEKWRTVSDSQLGWKPLRGRWNGWDEIYSDSWAANTDDPMARASQAAGEAMARRFTNAREKGSAASSVACFLRDLDTLRQSLMMLDMPDDAGVSRMGGIGPKQPISQRTGKAPIIRNPMIVDAD